MVSLVFSFLLSGCRDKYSGEEDLKIVWEGNKATKLIISKRLVGSTGASSVQVFLAHGNGSAILGGIESVGTNDEQIVFMPLIPFTHGLNYEVRSDNKIIGTILIPGAHDEDDSKVIAVYPTLDTVPQNLLKFYIEFSQPMREGEALQHIALIKNDNDTLQDEFLDLQPELWNNDRTVLTLWFDPGRIKRDLQPNLKMGPPLIKGNKYTLIVKKDWQNEDGRTLEQNFVKNFVAGNYDSLSPNTKQWKITTPKAGTNNALEVDFQESLDYMLVKNAISINYRGADIAGRFSVHSRESGFSFVPMSPWQKGEYILAVEARMEDLAGNNLDKLFDMDLMKKPEPYVKAVKVWHLKVE